MNALPTADLSPAVAERMASEGRVRQLKRRRSEIVDQMDLLNASFAANWDALRAQLGEVDAALAINLNGIGNPSSQQENAQ